PPPSPPCTSPFSFTHPVTTALYTLSLHDALPISVVKPASGMPTSFNVVAVSTAGRDLASDNTPAPLIEAPKLISTMGMAAPPSREIGSATGAGTSQPIIATIKPAKEAKTTGLNSPDFTAPRKESPPSIPRITGV